MYSLIFMLYLIFSLLLFFVFLNTWRWIFNSKHVFSKIKTNRWLRKFNILIYKFLYKYICIKWFLIKLFFVLYLILFYIHVIRTWPSHIIHYRTVSLLPKLTPQSHRVLCVKTNPVADNEKFDIMLFCRVTLGHLDLQLKQEPLHGHVFLYDLKHVNMSQLLAFTPTITKNLFKCCIVSIII